MSKFKNLTAMMNRTWQSKNTGSVYKFLGQSKIQDEITIATDGEWLKTTVYDLNIFMNDFIEVVETAKGEVMIVKDKHDLPTHHPVKLSSFSGERMTEIADVLMDNIRKVKEDANYVKQATSISNTVQTLINLASAELKIKAEQ